MNLWKTAASEKGNTKSGFLRLGKQQWLALLLMGLLLATVMLPVKDSGRERTEAKREDILGSGDSAKRADTENRTELEAKLERILSDVEGVGATRVMLMTAEEDSPGFSSSGTQKVTGALIAAEGADNPVTIQKIQEAVMALFQVEAHKIKVMKMK